MSDLDRQLAELALINKVDLQPSPVNTSGRKVGPAVPPKPKKNQPQVRKICKILFLLILNINYNI